MTPKQRVFVDEYLKDLNATQAAIRAKYSAKSAEKIGAELLRKTGVKEAVDAALAARSKRTKITADKVLRELGKIAFVDLAEAYTGNGSLKDIHLMPKRIRHAIAGIDVFDEFGGHGKERTKIGEVRKVKLNDKTRALELIGKHLGMFKEKIEHSGPDGKPIELNTKNLSDEQVNARIAELLAKKESGK